MKQLYFTPRDLQVIQSVMKDTEMDHIVSHQNGRIDAVLNAQGRISTIQLQFIVSRPYLHLHCVCSLCIDPDDQEQIREVEIYQAQINSILKEGYFVTDHSTGQIRFSLTNVCGDAPLSQELILDMIVKGTETFLLYIPGIYAILFDGMTAEEALKDCLGKILMHIDRNLSKQKKLEEQKWELEWILEQTLRPDEKPLQVNLHPELLRMLAEREERKGAAENPSVSEEATQPLFRGEEDDWEEMEDL